MLSFYLGILGNIGVCLTSALVIKTSETQESSEEDNLVTIEEVKVTYDDELENILRKAANGGDVELVQEIFNKEVSSKYFLFIQCLPKYEYKLQIQLLQNWIRKRAFDYIEQGVMLKGENVNEAKLVVDKIKVNLTPE